MGAVSHAFNDASFYNNKLQPYQEKEFSRLLKENYIHNDYQAKFYLPAANNNKPIAALAREEPLRLNAPQIQSRTIVIERYGFGGGANRTRLYGARRDYN